MQMTPITKKLFDAMFWNVTFYIKSAKWCITLYRVWNEKSIKEQAVESTKVTFLSFCLTGYFFSQEQL